MVSLRIPIENLFNPIICQIYGIDRLSRLEKRIDVIAVLEDRLLHLLVIAGQLAFLNRLKLCRVAEILKSEHKVMQFSMCIGITIEDRQAPSSHMVAFRILTKILALLMRFGERLFQI